MKTLKEIQKQVNSLAKSINAKKSDLPTYGESKDFGYPHIEISNGQYHYVVVERGQELERNTTKNLDELIYWVFRSVTHCMAFDFELENRIEDQDCRRIAFPKQLELMGILGPKFRKRAERDIDLILKKYPYDDEPIKRVNRMQKS